MEDYRSLKKIEKVMIMVRISVIIPVYNVENYLNECLDSVLNQTFEDFEVICINDGSTDSSLDILRTYEKMDSRVRIISQENKGAGASRNIALKKACGEYVYFMDSDDYLKLTAFEELMERYYDKNPDFIMFKINNFIEQSGETIDDVYYRMPYLKERVGDNSFCYDDVGDFLLRLCVCPPSSIYNRKFIKDIRFPEGLLFEDNVFFTHAIFKAQKVYFYDEFLYNRRRRLDSTTAPISVRSLDVIEITNILIDLCNEYDHKEHMRHLYKRIFHDTYQIFKNADSSKKEELFEKIKSEYLKNKDKWESEDYFANNLNAEYRHRFNCAIKSRNAHRFERCVDSYPEKSKLKKLRNRLL